MKKTVITLMVITVISQILGFGRDLTLAYFFGASTISDVYIISLTITGSIFVFIGIGITNGYIPLYSEIVDKQNRLQGLRFTNNLVNIVIAISTVLIIIGFIFAEQLVRIFASGFDAETVTLAVLFIRITFLSIYTTVLTRVFNAYLQANENFVIPSIIPLAMNVIVIVSIIISYYYQNYLLAVGYAIATLVQLIILVVYSYRYDYKYRFIIDFKDKSIRKLLLISIPIIIGTSIHQINIIVDRTLASRISVGGISSLNYANTINGFVLAVFVTTITTVLFPRISNYAAQNNIQDLKRVFLQVLVGILVLVIPATTGILMLSDSIVLTLFGRGAFDAKAIALTSNALFYYSIGLVGVALTTLISSVFYSLQDSKTPMINAAIAMVLNIILNIILSRYLGIGGLALATSISAIVCTVLLIFSLNTKLGNLGLTKLLVPVGKILVASISLAVLVKLTNPLFVEMAGVQVALFISIFTGALVYFLAIYLLKLEEVLVIIEELKAKLKPAK